MIEVKNLTKIFSEKNHKNYKIKALDDLSFTLESSGMVFILGKSGSGKSTLLNILGGLDVATSGNVFINGTDIEKLSASELNQYRALNISFIFQDHHLIDNLTVYQNILLGLNAVNRTDDGRIKDLLEKVDLQEAIDKYPFELSGGMRQRAAVVRALVKNPDIILCDEPTGNLDNTTATLVLDMLKELSKEKLVIIVSHNSVDAFKYGDRIIEIFGGKIISDKSKGAEISDTLDVEDDTIYLPHRALNNDEVDILNKLEDKKKIKLKTDLLVDSKEIASQDDKTLNLDDTKFYKKSYKHLMSVFIKKRIKSICISSFLLALLIGCFVMFQSLLNFDSSQAIVDSLERTSLEQITVRKSYYIDSTNYDKFKMISPISDEEYQNVINSSYNGNAYKLYNYCVFVNEACKYVESEELIAPSDLLKNFYAQTTLGTLQCDLDYLKDKFAINGELNYVGDIYSKEGVIITDYMADYLIYYYGNPSIRTYENLLGPELNYKGKASRFAISAVIITDYQEKYQEGLQAYIEKDTARLSQYVDSDAFTNFCEDVMNRLALGYTLSSSFLEDNSKTLINQQCGKPVSDLFSYITLNHGFISSMDNGKNVALAGHSYYRTTATLKKGEIAITYDTYNKLFGTSYTKYDFSGFTPAKVKIIKYNDPYNPDKGIYSEFDATVIKLVEEPYNCIYISVDDFEELFQKNYILYGLVFDNLSELDIALDVLGDNYQVEDVDSENIAKVKKIILLYEDFCRFTEIILIVIIIIYIMFFSINNIRANRHEIGIMKSLGVKDLDVGKICIMQNVLMGGIIVLFGYLASYIIVLITNDIMIKSIKDLSNLYIYKMDIISFFPGITLIDLLIAFGVVMISSVIPFIMLKRFKPIEIIKAKE